MAIKKISDLDAVTSIGNADLMQIAQNGAWKKLTASQLKSYCNPVQTIQKQMTYHYDMLPGVVTTSTSNNYAIFGSNPSLTVNTYENAYTPVLCPIKSGDNLSVPDGYRIVSIFFYDENYKCGQYIFVQAPTYLVTASDLTTYVNTTLDDTYSAKYCKFIIRQTSTTSSISTGDAVLTGGITRVTTETVVVDKMPYLNDNGSLMVYDSTAQDFADTGISKSPKSVFTGKKWLVIGDSMSYQNGVWSGTSVTKLYYNLIAAWTGLTTNVQAVSGTGYWAGSDTSTSFLDRVAALDYSDVDMITIFGSCNDWGYVESDTNLGTLGDTGNTTLYGRIYQTLNTLITNNPYKPIGVITTLPRKTIYGTAPTAYYVKAVKAVVDVAEYFGLPVLDIYRKSGLRPWIRDANDKNSMFADNIHPNNAGHYVLAQQIYSWMMDNLCWFGGSTT